MRNIQSLGSHTGNVLRTLSLHIYRYEFRDKQTRDCEKRACSKSPIHHIPTTPCNHINHNDVRFHIIDINLLIHKQTLLLFIDCRCNMKNIQSYNNHKLIATYKDIEQTLNMQCGPRAVTKRRREGEIYREPRKGDKK